MGAISSKGGDVEAQCAPLLSFMHTAVVEGLDIPFATADLEVVALDKALEAQRMQILKRCIPRASTWELRGPVSRIRHDARTHGI